MIEFYGFYQPGTEMKRCSECGAVVCSVDTNLHKAQHESVEALLNILVERTN